MNARSQTHMIVSEVEIFAAAAAPAGIADLARLTVGDEPVEGFAPDVLAYTAASTGAAWPTLHALAVDEDASVVVTPPGDGEGTGSVRVTAPDGTERTYTVTIARTVGLATPAIVGEARVGSTVRATVVADPADAALTYVWLRDGAPIVGATADAYALTAEDEGREVAVEVTAAADGFAAGAARSSAIVPAAASVDPGNGGGDGSGGGSGDGSGGDAGTGGGSSAGAGSGSGAGASQPSTGATAGGLATTGLNAEGVAATAAGAVLLLLGGGGLVLLRRRRTAA